MYLSWTFFKKSAQLKIHKQGLTCSAKITHTPNVALEANVIQELTVNVKWFCGWVYGIIQICCSVELLPFGRFPPLCTHVTKNLFKKIFKTTIFDSYKNQILTRPWIYFRENIEFCRLHSKIKVTFATNACTSTSCNLTHKRKFNYG